MAFTCHHLIMSPGFLITSVFPAGWVAVRNADLRFLITVAFPRCSYVIPKMADCTDI